MSAWEAAGKSDDWYTPPYIFEALRCNFDMDVAGPGWGKCHAPADCAITRESLTMAWFGFVWMNPPFGGRNGLEPWLDKFFDHGNGIALVPDRTSAPWFQRAAKRANALLFISPKVKFERPDGTLGKSPGCGTVLMSAGSRGRAAIFRAGKLGFVALPNEGAGGLDEVNGSAGSSRSERAGEQHSSPPAEVIE